MEQPTLPYYIDKYLLGCLTAAEWKQLRALLKDPENVETLGAIMDQQLPQYEKEGYEEVAESSLVKLLAAINKEETVVRPVHRVHFLKKWWWAAAAVLVIGTAVAVVVSSDQQLKSSETGDLSVIQDIAPGGNKAILILAGGSTVELNSAANGQLTEEGGSNVIKREDGVVEYAFIAQDNQSSVSYNTMSTPKGGQYQLILPDGTHAWLNAASSITFPTSFKSDKREVSITGEVYFEVTKDKARPFVVKTTTDQIEVLGTKFNVNAYLDEPSVKTSLLEGRVKIKETVLSPGDMYVNGRKSSTNVQQDIAWKNGMFDFAATDIRSIMRQISRWYNVEVVFDSEEENELFTFESSRDIPLNSLLDNLSVVGKLKFSVDKNVITVSK